MVVRQTITPPLPAAVIKTVLEYVDDVVFRGSRRMPIDDVVIALSDDTVMAISGLPGAHATAIKLALRNLPAKRLGATSLTADTGRSSSLPVSTPAPVIGGVTVGTHSSILVVLHCDRRDACLAPGR